jgi:hypothetical protein
MSLMDSVVSPTGCGRSVTDFDVGTPMRRSYVVPMRWMMIYEVPRGALNQVLLNYPDHGHNGNLPLQGKIPMVEPGIEPGTSISVVKNSDHKTTRLFSLSNIRRLI